MSNLKKDDISCLEAFDMIADYVDGECVESDREALTNHIESCQRCKRELGEQQELIKIIGDSAIDPPKDLRKAVMRKIRREKIFSGKITAALCTAASFIFIVGVVYVFSNSFGMNLNNKNHSKEGSELDYIYFDAYRENVDYYNYDQTIRGSQDENASIDEKSISGTGLPPVITGASPETTGSSAVTGSPPPLTTGLPAATGAPETTGLSPETDKNSVTTNDTNTGVNELDKSPEYLLNKYLLKEKNSIYVLVFGYLNDFIHFAKTEGAEIIEREGSNVAKISYTEELLSALKEMADERKWIYRIYYINENENIENKYIAVIDLN
ncbi:MAG: zf-HC2 domain-containing protein [Oscillospiraceae bacterium]|nr:zf-HC2 domain-containing protein [Oscillospiraceae bacterium]